MRTLRLAGWLCTLSILLSSGAAQTTVDGPREPHASQRDEFFVSEILRQALSTSQGNQSLLVPVQNILQGIPAWIVRLQGPLQGRLTRINSGMSPLCVNQTIYMMKNLQSPWAAAMLDSFGRRPSGVLEGNLKWLGDFDECVNAKTSAGDQVQLRGSYCKFPITMRAGSKPVAATVGGCFPNGCSSSDVKNFVLGVIEEVTKINRTDKSIAGFHVDCQPETRPLSAGAIIAIIICSMFGVGVLVGTAYDAWPKVCETKAKAEDQEQGSSVMELSQLGASACSGANLLIAQPVDQLPQKEPRESGIEDKVQSQSLQSSDAASGGDFGKNLPGQESNVMGSALASGSGRTCYTREPGRLGRLLLCFSIYTNGRKLLSASSPGARTLSCIHGIRFISMCWVVLGHTYYFSAPLAGAVGTFVRDTAQRESFQAIANATFSVDTFFVISSLLFVYLMLVELEKRSGRLTAREWVFIYVHRYLRLTGVYAVVLMLWTCLTYYLYNGPQWWTSPDSVPACTENWWTNLLYVNNFVIANSGVSCMGWAWYLANDMQMFLITPIITFIMYHFVYVGFGLTLLLTLGSIAASSISAKEVNFTLSLLVKFLDPVRGQEIQNNHYIKPWNRFQAYGVGIMAAYLIYRYKGKYTIPKVLAVMGWIIAAGSATAALYGPYELTVGSRQFTHSVNETAIYVGISRFAWALGVAWVIYVCCTGQGGWINQLLSWKPFVPLGRLCYCAYLVHPIIMISIQRGGRDVIHFDDVTMIIRFLGELSLTLAVSFATSLVFEAPLLRVQKLALGGDS